MQDVSRAHMASGDFATAAERLEEARGLWVALDNRPMLGENLTVAASMRMFDGEIEVALADAREAFSIAEAIENAWGQAHSLTVLYRIQLDRGDFGAAIASMDSCRELGERGGFTFAAVASRAELAQVLSYLGDGERALALADEGLAIALERIPAAATTAHVARAEAFLTLGDHVGARAALLEVDLTKLPEPDRTHARVASGVAAANLSLLEGDPVEAGAVAREVVDHLRARGVHVLLARALIAAGRAHAAVGARLDAEAAFAEAVDHAQRMGERPALWEVLAATADLRARAGEEDDAVSLRRRAGEVVATLAADIPDDDLRTRFLARADVRGLA